MSNTAVTHGTLLLLLILTIHASRLDLIKIRQLVEENRTPLTATTKTNRDNKCGLVLCLVSILFSVLANSLSYITIPCNKG